MVQLYVQDSAMTWPGCRRPDSPALLQLTCHTVLDAPQQGDRNFGSWTCQVIVSWPYRPGFFGNPIPTDVPRTNVERLAFMRRLAAPWTEPFRSIVYDITNDTEAKAVVLEDWVPQQGVQENGRITMIGDAAHPMTMCTSDMPLSRHAPLSSPSAYDEQKGSLMLYSPW